MNAPHHKAKGTATTVLGVTGRFYQGEVPGAICFVPLVLVEESRLNCAKYVAGQWASLNIKAQRLNRRLKPFEQPMRRCRRKPRSAKQQNTLQKG